MPLVVVASGGIWRNQVCQAPHALTADTKEIATKKGHGGRQLGGAVDSSKATLGVWLWCTAQGLSPPAGQLCLLLAWQLELDSGFLMLGER